MPPLLLLDTNLLVLFTVGLADPDYIARHKRLRQYDQIDHEIVSDMVAQSGGLLLTPNVVTETSNLVCQVHEPIRTEAMAELAALVEASEERYVPSRSAMAEHHRALGVTDMVLLTLARTGARLITTDFDLYQAAATAGLDVTNYTHIQAARPDFP